MAKHPLQRFASPSLASLALHLTGVASFTISYNFLLNWDVPIAKSYGWHFQFLTIIGLTLSFIATIFGVLADVTGSAGIFRVKNALAVVATPLEVLISILYWGIKFIDPSLLMPEGFRISLGADLGFHLAPAVVLSLDLLLFSPPWTIPAYGIMTISTVFAFGYWYWVELCYKHNGWYTYPIFAVLNTQQRVGLFASSAVILTVSYSLLRTVYGRLNGYEPIRLRELKKTQ